MKIFGYEIKKAKRDKYVLIIPKGTDGKVNCVELVGSDWEVTERLSMKNTFETLVSEIESKIPHLLATDVVEILNIFLGRYYEFKLQENTH